MRIVAFTALFLCAQSMAVAQEHPQRKPLQSIDEALSCEFGAQGFLHGSIPCMEEYVWTYGKSVLGENFSLRPENDDVRKALKDSSWHQQATLWGRVVENKATPQRHIMVTKIQLGKPWQPKVDFEFTKAKRMPYLSDQLGKKVQLNCLVHGIAHGGRVLVIEYGGWPIPVAIDKDQVHLTKDLWSNDVIMLSAERRAGHGKGPVHLSLQKLEKESPIKMLSSMKEANGKKIGVQGMLTWYPKSPFTDEAWAVSEMRNGVQRTFFLIPAKGADAKALDEKLRQAWKKHKKGFIAYAGRFAHPAITVTVSGTVRSTQYQGNPALLVDPKDVVILK